MLQISCTLAFKTSYVQNGLLDRVVVYEARTHQYDAVTLTVFFDILCNSLVSYYSNHVN